uniref:ILEI/PANDER domain-containing protein n=1 Tax=Periophthalmus magnuspinnatus TaxID=409849 RepID=A0A3B4AUG2_9GOBI
VEKKNAGVGINAVIINGLYVNPLIELLKTTETGSIVLMASYDEASSKLNDEARELILNLGSSFVKSLGFRDNWIFVGGKGAEVNKTFEKHMKHDPQNNKYEFWPELIDLTGCIPKYPN